MSKSIFYRAFKKAFQLIQYKGKETVIETEICKIFTNFYSAVYEVTGNQVWCDVGDYYIEEGGKDYTKVVLYSFKTKKRLHLFTIVRHMGAYPVVIQSPTLGELSCANEEDLIQALRGIARDKLTGDVLSRLMEEGTDL